MLTDTWGKWTSCQQEGVARMPCRHADVSRATRFETSGPFPSSSVYFTQGMLNLISKNLSFKYSRRFNKLQTVPPHAIGPVCLPTSFLPSASSLPPVSISVVSAAHYNGFYGVLPPCPLLLRSFAHVSSAPFSVRFVRLKSRHVRVIVTVLRCQLVPSPFRHSTPRLAVAGWG